MKIKGIYFLYRILQAFGLPLVLFYFLYRAVRSREYARFLAERFGSLPRSLRQTGPGAIWLHAVSLGEVLACVEFARRLRKEFPHTRLVVSSSTAAGRAAAADKFAEIADGIFYAPVDYVFAVRRVLRTLRPWVVIVAETEIWPNLFREVKRTGAGLAIVNGRISDRAFGRYQKLGTYFGAVLPQADAILAQTDGMRDRFLALGAPPERVQAGGNFKYDFEPRPSALAEQLPPGRLWIAASTTAPAQTGDPDEDDAVIASFAALSRMHPDLRLILAPRKPERFGDAARKLEAAGIPYARRSATRRFSDLPPVLLLDTVGELAGLFAVADVVFMGGTLAHRGGHNILEPAFFGKPVIVGPHLENFQSIADEFRAADACVPIADAAELAGAVGGLLEDSRRARAIGERALSCARARRGATARAVEEVRELYARSMPRYLPAMPWYAMRWTMAQGWKAGSRRRLEREGRRRQSLPVPVISVGNLSMGGTGKTPGVLRLAELLKTRGRQPGILTRGYRRISPEPHLVFAPGDVSGARGAGDEPQIFIRSGLAPVGVGADRFDTGSLLCQEFHVDVVLLDDGFQHVRLRRDVDIVLIDALDPLSGGDVFPVGRLRESPEGLARASMVLITRSEFADTSAAIERMVRRWNPRAPIYRAGVQPRWWVEHRSGQRWEAGDVPFERPGVFCGLGNPRSFRKTLENMAIDPVDWVDFSDHHHYRPHELRRLAFQFASRGAKAIVTTEKDAVNLCGASDDLLAPLRLYVLEIRMRVEGESEFLDELMSRIREV